MSTREQTKKTIFLNIRVTAEALRNYKSVNINISDTCRQALEKEYERLKEEKHAKNARHKS